MMQLPLLTTTLTLLALAVSGTATAIVSETDSFKSPIALEQSPPSIEPAALKESDESQFVILSDQSAMTYTEKDIRSRLTALRMHLRGYHVLTDNEINVIAQELENAAPELTDSERAIEWALQLTRIYDQFHGTLFENDATANGFERGDNSQGMAIHHAIVVVHQMVIDYAYAGNNLERFQSTFENRSFSTSEYFPGAMRGEVSEEIYSNIIKASNPETDHRPFGAMLDDVRRPTGAYAPPGNLVSVTVPQSMVNAGFQIRVGAHTWDLQNKSRISRLDRVSILFPVTSTTTVVSNPLGGGIYIEVPYGATASDSEVRISNAIRSPFYDATTFRSEDNTTAQEWVTEKAHPAPWADLEGDHFMIQVPSAWLDIIEDPAELMAEWDDTMQSILDLHGVTETNRTMFYAQIDTILRGAANFPGYPMSNFPYSPATPAANNVHQALIRSPKDLNFVTFHEIGHQLLFTKFQGEVESVVHLPYVKYQNEVYGVDIDTAVRTSTFRNSSVNLDEAFRSWAVRPNFQAGLPMRSARPNSEKSYQRRGFGAYVTIAKLFGWEPLEEFWASEHVDFLDGIDYNRNSAGAGDTDSRILRMSRAANIDLRPILHVWGVHPENAVTLESNILSEGLLPSGAIYDELQRLKTLIPSDNDAFETHARRMYPTLRSNANTEAFEGWYFEKAKTYNEADAAASLQTLQNIIDLYFPTGSPAL